ncbi:MAG: hypothetical protein ACFFD4_12465 [Candidatus Odinarchaeota archaeon]
MITSTYSEQLLMGKTNKNDHAFQWNDYLQVAELAVVKADVLLGKQSMIGVDTGSQLVKAPAVPANTNEREGRPVTSKKSSNYDYSRLTAVYLFKHGKHGPELVPPCDDTACSAGLAAGDLDRLGCYYSLALGQGDHYNEGLYGPLPVLGTGFHSLLHAVVVTDNQQEDPRMGNRNYLIACVLYPEQLEETIHGDRDGLAKILRAFFAASDTVEKARCNAGLLDVLIRQRLFCMTACRKREP